MKAIENKVIIFLPLVFFFPLTRSKLRTSKKNNYDPIKRN